MGQEEVYAFLMKQSKPVARRDIAKAIYKDPSLVGKLLKVMIRHGEVDYKTVDYKIARKKYGLKRSTREYYIRKKGYCVPFLF